MKLRGLPIFLFLTGCSTMSGIPDEWPSNWPTLQGVKSNACPNLEGTYRNVGEAVYSGAMLTTRTLSVRLIKFGPRSSRSSVRLTQPSDAVLEVEVIEQGAVLRKETLFRNKGDFHCDDEGLWVRPSKYTAKDGTGYGHSSTSLGFRPADGRVLAAKERTSGIAVIGWLIPIPLVQTIWYRWDPSDDRDDGRPVCRDDCDRLSQAELIGGMGR